MNVNFKKLLPTILQNTRWGQLIESFQNVIEQIRADKIDIFKNQYIVDNMTDTNIFERGRELGYIIPNFAGYTSKREYLLRQLFTIIPRILKRNVSKGYEYLGFIYNLDSQIYPMYYENFTFRPILNWKTLLETPDGDYTLDRDADNALLVFRQDWNLDDGTFTLNTITTTDNDQVFLYQDPINDGNPALYLDTEEFRTLDMTNIMNMITRHVLFSYKFNHIEDDGQFMSENFTGRALYYDILRQKRRTEIMYFEPYLEFETEKENNITKETYYTWDKLSSAEVLSKPFPYESSGVVPYYDLSSASIIRFGSNKWGEDELSTGSINDVKDFAFQINLNLQSELTSGEIVSGTIHRADVLSRTENELEIRRWIYQKNKTLPTFSEIAVLDSNSGCIYYSEFPEVHYHYRMNRNVALKINLI